MEKVKIDKYYNPGFPSEKNNIIRQAAEEYCFEEFRKAVEEQKLKILTKKPFWTRIFKYRIKIERI